MSGNSRMKYDSNHWMGIGIGVGLAIGMPVGLLIGILVEKIAIGIALGPAIGTGLGTAIGTALQKKYSIPIKESNSDNKQQGRLTIIVTVFALILAFLLLVYKLL